MKFGTASAPHWRPAADVAAMMRQVLYALMPAGIAYTFFFGPGLLINAPSPRPPRSSRRPSRCACAGRPQRLFLSDGSAVVTALSAGLLPAAAHPLVGHGGSAPPSPSESQSISMAGSASTSSTRPWPATPLLLVSFPGYLTFWLPPQIGDLDYQPLSLLQTLYYTVQRRTPGRASPWTP